MSSRPNRKIKPSSVRARSRNRMLAVVGVIAVIIVLVAAIVVLSQNNLTTTNLTPSPSGTTSPNALPSGSPSSTATPLTSPAGQYSADGTRVLLQTSMGDIVIQLRDDKPITTTNFVNLVNQGIYDGTLFHRVIEGFMIQGGVNASAQLSTINDEIGNNNRNTVGTIAMAKTSQPNSATSSFFINVDDNGNNIIDQAGTRFDSVYTVFGTVIDGMDVVYAISNVAVQNNGYGEVSSPVQPITLINAEVIS